MVPFMYRWARHESLKLPATGNFTVNVCPKDAVASMNPKLVRKKGPGLPSPVTTLGSSDSIPLCGLSRLWNDQTRGDQHGTEKGWKRERIKSERRPQCGAGKSWPISHK